MIGSSTLAVAAATAVVAGAAVWFSIPTVIDLEGELWFKRLLAERLAARGLDPGAHVPYHPLGRMVERKLAHPGLESLPGAALPGEAELVKELAAHSDVASRYGHMFDGTRHADLHAVEGAQDPETWLGPGHGWDAWGSNPDSLCEAAELRRGVKWVVVSGEVPEGVPDLMPALERFATVLPGPLDADEPKAAAEALAEELLTIAGETRSQRLIVAGVGTGMVALLRALYAAPGMRDRVVAVLSLGGTIGGWEGREGLVDPSVCRDWNEANFRHEAMDVEVVREVPYLCLQWIDPVCAVPGVSGVGVHASRFPEPGFLGRESPMVRVVDLGVLPVGAEVVVDEIVVSLRLVAGLCALTRL